MFIIQNMGATREFNLNGRPYFMGRGNVKHTEDRKFAEAMDAQRHVIVRGLDNIDNMKIGALRHLAKQSGVSLERGDKAVDIRLKIRAATSL